MSAALSLGVLIRLLCISQILFRGFFSLSPHTNPPCLLLVLLRLPFVVCSFTIVLYSYIRWVPWRHVVCASSDFPSDLIHSLSCYFLLIPICIRQVLGCFLPLPHCRLLRRFVHSFHISLLHSFYSVLSWCRRRPHPLKSAKFTFFISNTKSTMHIPPSVRAFSIVFVRVRVCRRIAMCPIYFSRCSMSSRMCILFKWLQAPNAIDMHINCYNFHHIHDIIHFR